MEAVEMGPRTIQGVIRLKRVHWLRFPHYELTAEGSLIAHLARDSSLWIFFGPGRRIRLADGTEWRVKAVTRGRLIVPIIKASGGTVAFSGPLQAKRSHGITGKGFAYEIVPRGSVGLRKAGRWTLRRHEEEVGVIYPRRRELNATEPVPIAAVIMAFTVLAHGTPGDVELLPGRD